MGTPRKCAKRSPKRAKQGPNGGYKHLLEAARMESARTKLQIARLGYQQEQAEAAARAKLLTIVNRLMPQAGMQAGRGKPRLLACLARILKSKSVRVHV